MGDHLFKSHIGFQDSNSDWVWQYTPIVPDTGEAEEGELLEARDLNPAWAAQRDPMLIKVIFFFLNNRRRLNQTWDPSEHRALCRTNPENDREGKQNMVEEKEA